MNDEEIKDLYKDGYSVKQIAELMGMYESAVLAALKR